MRLFMGRYHQLCASYPTSVLHSVHSLHNTPQMDQRHPILDILLTIFRFFRFFRNESPSQIKTSKIWRGSLFLPYARNFNFRGRHRFNERQKVSRGDCEVTGVCLSTIPMVHQVSSQCLRDEKIHAIKTKVNERLI